MVLLEVWLIENEAGTAWCCRNGRGAAPSMAVYNDELVKLDPDWIIICPCGLDIQVSRGHTGCSAGWLCCWVAAWQCQGAMV